MLDCIFCKIAMHEVPGEILYEVNEILAFKDIQPLAPVHLIVMFICWEGRLSMPQLGDF